MPHVPRTPLAVISLDPEETEAAVTLGVRFTSIQVEALRDGGLHLGDGTSSFAVDVGADAMAAVHDEGTVVHPLLGCRDEVEVVRPAGPGGVNVCVGVEDGLQVLPFARIADETESDSTISVCASRSCYLPV